MPLSIFLALCTDIIFLGDSPTTGCTTTESEGANLPAKFICPNCGRSGSVKKEIPTGAKIRCPQCQTLFLPNNGAESPQSGELSDDQVEEYVRGDRASCPPLDDEPWPNGPLPNTGNEPASQDLAEVPIRDLTKPPSLPMAAHVLEPSVFLFTVRAQTCYRSLRILVGILSGLLFVAIAFCGVAFMVSTSVGNGAGVGVFVGAIIVVIGIFLAYAYREASSLLIDIADILIEQNRRNA